MKKISFKEDVDPKDIWKFTDLCRILFTEVMYYFYENNLDLKITSLHSDRVNVKAISRTHETGRAFDISIKRLSADQIVDIEKYFNCRFKNIAAISYSDGRARCAIAKSDHIHFQVRPN